MNNPPPTPLVLDMVMCDWLTLTSFENVLYQAFLKKHEWITDFQEVSRMQYTGRQYASLFMGTADQGGRHHNMVQISGAAADDYFGEWSVVEGVRCSRMDIQVTCNTAKNFDMFSLAERQRKRGRLVGFIESGGLATVYIGSWKSNKFLRIYQKAARVIRLEACYKGSRADFLHRWLGADRATDRAKMRGWLRSELEVLEDDQLNALFGHALYGDANMPKMTARPESNTERWLLGTVARSLAKYVNSHDCNHDVIAVIKAALEIKGEDNELE